MIREFFSPRVFFMCFLLWLFFYSSIQVWKRLSWAQRGHLLTGASGVLVTMVFTVVLMFGLLFLLN